MAEVRSPYYNHVQQTPRIGGCTGAFFNLFDWNNTKRLASTKRLLAERPEKPLRRSKSFRDDRRESGNGSSPSVKADRGVVSEDEASSRPGVVARLMGLESLPDATPSPFVKHRRSESFSGSGSMEFSDSRRVERLALRDFLKQEHAESYEKKAALITEILAGPVEAHKSRQEKSTRKVAAESPIKSIVPYENSSPTGLCRSVYALPYVRGNGESKTPFLSRLHPSPVLQPSKCHNQMVSPRTNPAAQKRVSRFLEAAGKILEEISDNEQCFPREREEVRSKAEYADASPPSNAADLLHCRSMSRVWHGSEDAESVGSRSTRSLVSRGSVSFRDGSQRGDRICRDIFETSFSELAQSVSRRPSPTGVGAKEPRILRTQEAAVGGFKTHERKASPGSRKGSGEAKPCSMSRSTDHSQQPAAPVRERIKRLHFHATKISNGLEDGDLFTSDEESPTHQELSTTSPRKFKTLEVDRSSLRKPPRMMIAVSSPARSAGDRSVPRESRELIAQRATDATSSPLPQLRTRSTSVNPLDGLRPIKLSRNRGSQQENAQVAVSSNRTPSSAIPKSRGERSSSNHSRLSTRQSVDGSKLSVRIKNDNPSKQEKQTRRAAESPAAPALHCPSPLPSAASLKRTRRKSKQGSPTPRESSGPAKSVVSRSSGPNMQGERRNHHNLEATKSIRNPAGENEARRSVADVHPDIALPGSRIDGDEVEIVDVSLDSRDENENETGNGGQTQGPVGALLLSPQIGQCDNNADELILGMEDLHWDDGMAENSSRARYCQTRVSGESICGSLDEDVCNVDDASPPSPRKLAAERQEADLHDDGSTRVLMKRCLTKPLRLDVDMGETSPVSVLESLFGDEACTTSGSSITGSQHRAGNGTQSTNLTEINVGIDEEVTTPVSSAPSADKVRQALLDISSFTSCDYKRLPPAEGSPPSEKTFVREVLSAAQLLCSPGRSPNWYERDLAVDPSLFERLEGCEHGDYFPCESGGMWRCDRKLLFDCVNEAFSQNAGTFKDPQPWLRRPVVLRHRSARQRLVDEVHEKIGGWRELASHAIDTLIDIDMSGVGKWTDFSEQVADIGAEIEGMVWQVMLEEVVLELARSPSRR